MAKSKAPQGEESPSFENCMSDLEAIVRKLESGAQPLQQMLTDYAKAVELVQHCNNYLDTARRRIAQLESVRGDGTAVVQEWDDTAPVIRENAEAPSRRHKS